MNDAQALVITAAAHDDGLTRVHRKLDDDLARTRERLRTMVAPPNQKVGSPILYSVEHLGRLLRPSLVLLTSYLLEGEQDGRTPDAVIDAAATVEMLHIATLFHDDLIDQAQVRRGQPTANAKYGGPVALLAGDFLLARCMLAAGALGVQHMTVIAETLVGACVGQLLETTQLFDPLRTEQDYLDAIAGKTAHLLRACTTLGALQCGANEETRTALASFGHHVGMAFQIWDDILDLCAEDTGKETAKDLLNGVYTLPVIYAVKDSPDRMLSILHDRPLSTDQCQEVLTILHESGAINQAATVAQEHVSAAVAAVRSHPSVTDRAPVVERVLFDIVDRFASMHPALRALPEDPGQGT